MVALLFWSSLSSSAWGSAPSQNYVVILLDASGSMKQSDPQFLRRDATNLLISLLRDGDRLVLAEFGDEVRSLTDGVLVLHSQTRQTVCAATEKLSAQYQHTDILAACQYALQMVSALPSEVRQSFVPSVMLMTDGKDDVPGKPRRTHLIEEKSKELAKLGATVHTVGFSAAADLTLLRAIADLTGGDVCVINRDTDLLRGFFGLSRVLGKRWNLSEQLVGGGSVLLSLPEWAKRVVACYLPKSRSGERLQTQPAPDQEIVTPSYQLLRYNQLPNATLKLQIPSGGGMLLVDAEDELVLQALVGKKVPARIPLGIQARILPARVAAMGQPHFLTQMAMLITLKRDGQPEQTLQLLRNNMSSYKFRSGKRGLATLAAETPPPDSQDLQVWEELHAHLDTPLLRLNRLAVDALAEPTLG